MALHWRARQSKQSEKASSKNEDLEATKIELEIANLARSQWATPAVVVPLVLAAITLSLSQYLGVFDVERKRLENQAREAEINRRLAHEESTKVQTATAELKKLEASLKQRSGELQLDVQQLQQQVAGLTTQVDEKQKELIYTKEILARPNLTFHSANLLLKKEATLYLFNTGPGRAVATMIQLYVDGKRVSEGSIARPLDPLLNATGLQVPWIRWRFYPTPFEFKVDGRYPIVSIEPGEYTPERGRRISDAIARIGLDICYCSLLGSCTTLRKQPAPESAIQCSGPSAR